MFWVLLLIVLPLVLLDVLALRYGFDSRNTRSAGLSADWSSVPSCADCPTV